jgi:predicted anti-sigma-YlaC factor YlaD
VILAGAQPGRSANQAVIDRHFTRAIELSNGTSAGLFVSYAEAVALPAQDKVQFRELLDKALAIDPDAQPRDRLATIIAQRRARWLIDG